MATKLGKGSFGWIFLGTVAGIYAFVGLFDSALMIEGLHRFGSLLARVSPVILVVFVLMFLFSLFVKKRSLVRHLARETGIWAWLFAVLAGVLSAGPIYVWYPLLGELKQRGASNGLIATFLYSRALKLPLLPLMAHYFGWVYTVVVSACIVAFSVISGLLMNRLHDLPPNHTEDHWK
jgi:uncharacterized membrane protein YraQ (UPF0718 family)